MIKKQNRDKTLTCSTKSLISRSKTRLTQLTIASQSTCVHPVWTTIPYFCRCLTFFLSNFLFRVAFFATQLPSWIIVGAGRPTSGSLMLFKGISSIFKPSSYCQYRFPSFESLLLQPSFSWSMIVFQSLLLSSWSCKLAWTMLLSLVEPSFVLRTSACDWLFKSLFCNPKETLGVITLVTLGWTTTMEGSSCHNSTLIGSCFVDADCMGTWLSVLSCVFIASHWMLGWLHGGLLHCSGCQSEVWGLPPPASHCPLWASPGHQDTSFPSCHLSSPLSL